MKELLGPEQLLVDLLDDLLYVHTNVFFLEQMGCDLFVVLAASIQERLLEHILVEV